MKCVILIYIKWNDCVKELEDSTLMVWMKFVQYIYVFSLIKLFQIFSFKLRMKHVQSKTKTKKILTIELSSLHPATNITTSSRKVTQQVIIEYGVPGLSYFLLFHPFYRTTTVSCIYIWYLDCQSSACAFFKR